MIHNHRKEYQFIAVLGKKLFEKDIPSQSYTHFALGCCVPISVGIFGPARAIAVKRTSSKSLVFAELSWLHIQTEAIFELAKGHASKWWVARHDLIFCRGFRAVSILFSYF